MAAELWGVPVDEVLERARLGTIASMVDRGLTLIDVDPAPATPVGVEPRAWSPMPAPADDFSLADLFTFGLPPVTAAEDWRTSKPPAPVATTTSADVLVDAAVAPVEGPSAEELAALAAPLPSTGWAVDRAVVESAVPPANPRRRVRPKRPARPAVAVAVNDPDEDERGPDPNFGEAVDDTPLDWRQARRKAASTRRPPPPF